MKSKAIATVLKMIAALPEENLFGIGAVSQGRKRLLIRIGEEASVKNKFAGGSVIEMFDIVSRRL